MSTDETDEALDTSTPEADSIRAHHAKKPKSQFHPLKLFTDNAWAARIWFLLFLAALGAIVVQPFFIINAYRTKERVVILDGSGTYSIAPTMDFKQATRLHEEMALMATTALLSQNPKGFDMPELLDKLFLDDALRQARTLYSDSAQEFKEKHIHQKVEVFEIKVLQTRGEQVFAQVTGQLVRSGNFEGKAFLEDPEFTLTLTFYRNPNMLTNKRFPMAVLAFEEAIRL